MIQLFELIGFSFIICFILKAVFSKPKLSSPQETLDNFLTKAVDMSNVAKDNNILGDDDKSADLLHSADDKKLVKSVGKKVKTLIGVAAVVIFVLVPQALPIALVLLFLGGFLFRISSKDNIILGDDDKSADLSHSDGDKKLVKSVGKKVKTLIVAVLVIFIVAVLVIFFIQLILPRAFPIALLGIENFIFIIFSVMESILNISDSGGFKLLVTLVFIAVLIYLLRRCYKWIFSENFIDK